MPQSENSKSTSAAAAAGRPAEGDLLQQKCRELPKGTPTLADSAVDAALPQLAGWKREDGALRKEFKFKDFFQTIGFVNALAWLANTENHHPDLRVSYNKCIVEFSTHSVGGLSQNDLICAAKANALGQLPK